MLILSHRIGETIRIGDNIEVTILDINYTQVRIGINAPRNIHIVREELIGRPHQPQTAITDAPQQHKRRPVIRMLRSGRFGLKSAIDR